MLAKNNRKLEKKYKEALLQGEEERRHADQYKEQVSLLHFTVLVQLASFFRACSRRGSSVFIYYPNVQRVGMSC